ncbi:MAG: ABC transporter permease subunit [Oscillospiraceae bacterium]|nr:ABC transporter permease subunit [Oscillospiraceae bacterium]
MKAIFKHELSSWFTGMTAYVFAGFILLFGGIYTMAYNLNAMVSDFQYVVSSMSFVFLIIIPILSMRVLAEEKRQKTTQLLYSLPISMTQVVLGKFFAQLVVLALPVAVLSLYPLILSAFGNVHFPAAYGSLLGFWLLGAALLAMGLFVSSLTESQPVAAGVCFVVMLLNYFLADLADFVPGTAAASFGAFSLLALILGGIFWLMTRSGFGGAAVFVALEGILTVLFILKSSLFEGAFGALMEKLSLYEQFERFVNGVLDIRSIVYFISVIGVFLFLSVQSMERGRWSE